MNDITVQATLNNLSVIVIPGSGADVQAVNPIIIARINQNNVTVTPSLGTNIALTLQGVGAHKTLNGLDYDHAGHTGFQRGLVFDPLVGSYVVES